VGIHIDTFKVSKYRVDGLYLKLDKKLTLKANTITIPKRKANPSADRIAETLERVKYLLTFFEHIDLKEIHFDNNVLGIYYRDNILQLSSKDYLIRGNIHREGKMLKGTVPILQLKKHNITMRGEFTYDLHEDILMTEGKFVFQKTQGYFRVRKRKNNIDFALSSDSFSDLRSIIDKFNLNPIVKSWIVDRVQAKSYQVLSLIGEGNIVNKQFVLNKETLKGEALMSEVAISFKDAVAPVVARSCLLTYSNAKGLFFNLEKPRYLGKNLSGSSVSIVNLGDDNTTLKLNLKIDALFDKTVQELLKSYDIDIPVLQQNGKLKASFDMDIGLKNHFVDFVTDVNFTKGEVRIQNVSFPLVSGNLKYKDGFITLHDIFLKNRFYAGKLNGKVDVKKKFLTSVFDATYVKIGDKMDMLIDLENQKLPFTLDYSKGITVQIPKLALSFTQNDKVFALTLSDLDKVKKFISKDIPIEEGGNIRLETKDFKTFSFKGVMNRSACFLYNNKNVCNTKVPFEGTANKKNVDFYAFDKRFHYNKAKERIVLKNINIDLKKFLENEKKSKAKPIKSKKSKKLIILGQKSNLRYDDYSLITDSYDVEVKANGDIKAIGSAAGDIIKFTKKKDILSLQALRIKDKVLHPLINFDGLQKGRYSLTKSGKPDEVMKGEIIVEGGVMKGFKAYNNTLAFINTLPALATLHTPGYSNEGFTIISGIVEYRMIKRSKIIFDSIYIKGDAATIVGKGELDLEKKTINIQLGILVARELGKVVGSIPLVGYILVGKDKSVTVGLEITGSLDKPDVSVSAAKDILSYPLELIKRTIEAPGHLLSPEN